jgi:hypothetical protein
MDQGGVEIEIPRPNLGEIHKGWISQKLHQLDEKILWKPTVPTEKEGSIASDMSEVFQLYGKNMVAVADAAKNLISSPTFNRENIMAIANAMQHNNPIEIAQSLMNTPIPDFLILVGSIPALATIEMLVSAYLSQKDQEVGERMQNNGRL